MISPWLRSKNTSSCTQEVMEDKEDFCDSAKEKLGEFFLRPPVMNTHWWSSAFLWAPLHSQSSTPGTHLLPHPSRWLTSGPLTVPTKLGILHQDTNTNLASFKLFFSSSNWLDFYSWNEDGSSFRPSDSMVVLGATFHINCHDHYHILYHFYLINMRKGGNWDLPSSLFPVFRLYSKEKRSTLSFLLDTHGSRVLMRSLKMGKKARLVSVNTLLILLPFFPPSLPSH